MSRCAACPDINTCVAPDGPSYLGQPLFIGEAPGWEENRSGKPFIGKTGLEVNKHYLPQAGLKRENCRFTNAIKCLPDRPKGKLQLDKTADLELLQSCASHFLYKEIEDLQPSVLVPMGAFACYAIDPNINLEIHHGIPIQTELGVAFPMYHPAGGIHEPKKMLQIRTDWLRLKRFLSGTLTVPDDAYPQPDYEEASVDDLDDIDPTLDIACDTEYSRSLGPYCLTYSQRPGRARLIRSERKDMLYTLQQKLNVWEAEIYFHNWLYDWNVVEEMGLSFPDPNMRDSMVDVFHLGNLPQGLKTLSYRLLGMEMQDFEYLVKPYSSLEVLKYYKRAYDLNWVRPEAQLLMDEKTGKWKLYRPQSFKTKLKTFFTACRKNPNKDIFEMWTKNWVDHHAELEELVGFYPGMDIAHVPFDKALYYACRDADATLRLLPILKKAKKLAESGKPQEQWV